MRNAYLNTLYNLAAKDENVVSMVSDNGLIIYDDFRKSFPEQYFNFGISEGNMVTAAAGMASCGKIPFIYTIGAFLSYRSFEFIRLDVCLQNLNVKIVGIGAGVAYSTLGPTHHTTEDIAVLRALPNLTIFSPATPMEAKKIVEAAYKINGPVYIRLGTNNEPEIYDENYKFEIGKGVKLKEGKDITIISTGAITYTALKVANLLEKDDISARVINIHTIKPFDSDIIEKSARDTKMIITIEEHNIIGGLGSAVSEVIAEKGLGIKLRRIGLNDKFAKGYGKPEEVRIMNGLGEKEIYNKILEFIKIGE